MTSLLTNTPQVGPALERWRVHGLEVEGDLPGCDLPPGSGGTPDVIVRAADGPFPQGRGVLRHVANTEGTNPEIILHETDDGFVYEVEGIARFWIESNGRQVWHQVAPEAGVSDIDHLLAGPVLGLAYQLQGGITLHASSVMMDGKAIAFSAPHGFGKSTLASALTRMGFPLITDDVLPLCEAAAGWTALHSLPRAKLWPDSLKALGEEEDGYGEVVSWLPKKRLTIGRDFGSLAPDRLPLGGVYLLIPRLEPCPVDIWPVSPSDAAITLLGNFYLAEALRGDRAKAALDAAARLAERVSVRRISYHRAYDNIPAIRDAVLQDIQGMVAGGD